jgi:hypothetical protein
MGGKGNSSSDNSDTTAADGSSTFSTDPKLAGMQARRKLAMSNMLNAGSRFDVAGNSRGEWTNTWMPKKGSPGTTTTTNTNTSGTKV